jgi:hypothetical protein
MLPGMSLTDYPELDRLVRVQETLQRAREACAPLPPLPDDLLDRAARSLDQLPAEQPRRPGSYEAGLLQSVQRKIDAAIAEEREAWQSFIVELLARTIAEDVSPLQAKILELEGDLLQVRGLLHQQALVLKGQGLKKPRIRVRAGSRRRPNRVWPTGKSKENAAG